MYRYQTLDGNSRRSRVVSVNEHVCLLHAPVVRQAMRQVRDYARIEAQRVRLEAVGLNVHCRLVVAAVAARVDDEHIRV